MIPIGLGNFFAGRRSFLLVAGMALGTFAIVNLTVVRQSYSAVENLDEMVARKARFSTNSWPTARLENRSKLYTWQPESLCYIDVTTGHEVWVMTHAPDRQEIYSGEHATNAWSYDGSRIGFFSPNRPTANASLGDYHLRWVVNSDGSGLRAVEGYGRLDTPLDGFSWAHTENAYYAFGSHTLEASGSNVYRLFKNSLNSVNVVTGSLILDTSSANTYKKELVKDGISTDDSHATFRDLTSAFTNTQNPIGSAGMYFASLGASPRLNYYWGVARHIGPSTNNFSDPYGTHISSAENHWHDVWSPGPKGDFIMGDFSGTSDLFVIMKDHGSAPDGGPLWADWNGASFGSNNEIRVISNDTEHSYPNNPYNLPYFGHPAWDRWGKYALVGITSDNPRPGTKIYNRETNTLLPYSPVYNSYDGTHHSWTGWTDYVIGVNPVNNTIHANVYTGSYTNAFVVVDPHTSYSGNYNAYPRPSQSPDGTKVAFASTFLNNTADSYPLIQWAVVYYPSPPVNLSAQKIGGNVRIAWVRPSYTTRGWPNEATDPPPKAREIKGYHVWQSIDGNGGWSEVTRGAVRTEYADVSQPNGTTYYYAATSEEVSRLESRKLSAVIRVTLDTSGNLSFLQVAPEGKTGFWTTSPPTPIPSIFTFNAGADCLLKWAEPNNPKIRYYNIYYSSSGPPPTDQQHRIASVPVGTSSFLDWLPNRSLPAYYRVTSVDRQGNEGSGPIGTILPIAPAFIIPPAP